MDSQTLKAFVAVAEAGSFSLGAEKLHLTQSAASKRISQLEGQLNVRLFDRIARQVTLTEAGRALLPRAKRILQELDEARQAIRDLSGGVAGPLRLCISHHLGLHRLPPVLKSFATKYPQVELDVDFMDSEKAYEAILRGEFEVGVITLALNENPKIESMHIWDDPLVFVCAHEHPLARSANPTLKALSRYPAILPGMNTYTGRILKQFFDNEGVPLKSPMSTNYLETIRMMVSVGLGWSVLPATLAKELHNFQLPVPFIKRELGFIHHKEKSLSNAANAFIVHLKNA